VINGGSRKVHILDPPWYPDHTLLFLTAAADACVLGAPLLLCQPTDAARPSVERERSALLGELSSLGLELVEHRFRFLRYETPHFERMSLRKVLPATPIPGDWRVGDLLVLRKVAPRSLVGLPPVQVERWKEARFGPVRVKLRASRSAVEIEPLIPRDILHTVSRRDRIRQRIGMWTSGNRVYGIANPGIVGTVVDWCNRDLSYGRFSMSSVVAHAKRMGLDSLVGERLYSVLEVELSEHLSRDA
jgi:hypothetical protein